MSVRLLTQAEQYPWRVARAYHPGYDDPDLWLPVEELQGYASPDHPYDPDHFQLKYDRFREHNNHTLHPLVISTDGTHAVIDNGHHRVWAAKSRGIRELPVNVMHRDPDYFQGYSGTNPLTGRFKAWRATHQPGEWGFGRPVWTNTVTGVPDPLVPHPPPGWDPAKAHHRLENKEPAR